MVRIWSRKVSEIERVQDDINEFIKSRTSKGLRVTEKNVLMAHEDVGGESSETKEPWVTIIVWTD